MHLSDMQRAIVDAMRKRPGEEFDVEALAKAAYVDGRKRPKTYNVSIMQIMRSLVLKSTRLGSDFRIERTSAVGRGATARYRFMPAEQRKRKAA